MQNRDTVVGEGGGRTWEQSSRHFLKELHQFLQGHKDEENNCHCCLPTIRKSFTYNMNEIIQRMGLHRLLLQSRSKNKTHTDQVKTTQGRAKTSPFLLCHTASDCFHTILSQKGKRVSWHLHDKVPASKFCRNSLSCQTRTSDSRNMQLS